VRDWTFGNKCLKYRRALGMNPGIFRHSISSSRTFLNAKNRGRRQIEPSWGKPIGIEEVAFADSELLDQEKQAKPVHVQERLGPRALCRPYGGVYNSNGVMEVRDSSDVPGETSQGACEETGLIIDGMADYHFNDLLGKPGGRGRARRRHPWRKTTRVHSPDSG